MDKKKQYADIKIYTKGEHITFVASDETLDRMGEVLPIDSWDLSKYRANPLLLANHDYSVENIVGRARSIRIDKVKKQLTFDAEFHEITELAKAVKTMVMDGFLKTVSVGFIPHGPKKDGDHDTNELLEISFVPVPANPGAHALMMRGLESLEKDGISEETKAQLEKFMDCEVQVEEQKYAQTLILLKETFKKKSDVEKAMKEHDLVSEKINETNEYWICHKIKLVPLQEKRSDTPMSGHIQSKKGRAASRTKTSRNLDLRMTQMVAKFTNKLLQDAKRKRNHG